MQHYPTVEQNRHFQEKMHCILLFDLVANGNLPCVIVPYYHIIHSKVKSKLNLNLLNLFDLLNKIRWRVYELKCKVVINTDGLKSVNPILIITINNELNEYFNVISKID